MLAFRSSFSSKGSRVSPVGRSSHHAARRSLHAISCSMQAPMVHVPGSSSSWDENDVWKMNAAAPESFYELLGLEQSASFEEIRAAYRSLQRTIHPDLVGAEAHAMAILLNAAIEILGNPHSRAAYDADLKEYLKGVSSYDGRPVSHWCGSQDETRAIFVDEGSCIGCMQCTYAAPNTFFLEDEWGRARVSNQWGDKEEDIKDAVGSCPVDCISFVPRDHLALLEYVMKYCERENVATMARRRSGNMGSPPSTTNPFNKAEIFLRTRMEAKIPENEAIAGKATSQDEHLAAAIAAAWLKLPQATRAKAWPAWNRRTSADLCIAHLAKSGQVLLFPKDF